MPGAKEPTALPPLTRTSAPVRWLTVLAILLATLAPTSTALAPEPVAAAGDTDVLVYGASPGGIMAAIAAARAGMDVVLVEPTSHVGGMMTSGLSWTDRGDPTVIGGLADEFFDRAQAAEGSLRGRFAFEPSVAESIFEEMLDEAGVEVILNDRLAAASPVGMDGSRIALVVLATGGTYTAEVFIDASYEADLMAAAGVSHRIGREATTEYGEPLAGVAEIEVAMTVPPGIDPGFPVAAPGPLGSGDDRIQGSNFRLCLSDDPSNRVPFAAPPGYDPTRWDIVVEYMDQRLGQGDTPELEWAFHVDRLVHGKWDLNNVGPLSVGLPGANYDYPDASPAEREAIVAYHREHQQGLLYFLANDARVPQAIRTEIAAFGLCADEFVDNDNWPPLLYLREGRRMVGEQVVTQHDTRGIRSQPDVIGLASYRIDSHRVSRWIEDDLLLLEGKIATPAPLSWAIPYGTLVPQATEVSNLLVPVAASASHVAWTSLRMEPQFMIMGHAAGTAAAMAISADIAVQDVPIGPLQALLRSAGAVLDDPGDIGTSTFYDEIRWAYLEGNIGHCAAPGFFCPTQTVTRGMMAAFMVRALDLPATATDFFTDDETSSFEDSINRLAAAAITSGCTPTTFCPTRAVTRAEMATFLDRAYDFPDTTADHFTDDELSSHEGAINRLAEAGIATGCTPTRFCPSNPVTRGQMMAFLYRIGAGPGG